MRLQHPSWGLTAPAVSKVLWKGPMNIGLCVVQCLLIIPYGRDLKASWQNPSCDYSCIAALQSRICRVLLQLCVAIVDELFTGKHRLM